MTFNSLPALSIDLAGDYQNYFNQSQTKLADACPNSRFAWDIGYHYHYLLEADCLTLVSDGGVFTQPHFSLPLGPLDGARLGQIIAKLEGIFAGENWPFTAMFVDEAYLPYFEQLDGYEAHISYDDDFSDYVYEGAKLAKLKGKDYRAKRNHVNKFIRDYASFSYRKLSKEDKDGAVDLVRSWCEDKEIDCGDPLASDCQPISLLFDYWDELDVRGGVIFDNESLIAFSMASLIDQGREAVIHFEKADPAYEGLYAVINQLTVLHEFPDAQLINREEDMGDPGLRLAKESYLPLKKLRKYRVKLLKK